MMNLILIIILCVCSVLSIYLAVRNHKARQNKFANVEVKCEQVISIADKIIGNMQTTHISRRTNPVSLYPKINKRVTPFLSNEPLANSAYARLEFNGPENDLILNYGIYENHLAIN